MADVDGLPDAQGPLPHELQALGAALDPDADLDADTLFMEVSARRLAHANPFGDRRCVSVEISKDVSVGQLQSEIEAACGEEVQVVMTRHQPGGQDASAPLLHVCPPVAEDLLRQVIADHRVDPDHGLDPERKVRLRLLEDLRSGREMSMEDLRKALIFALDSA